MEKPTVHLNGTPAECLLDQYKQARHLVQEAKAALEDAAPNARDYYVQPDGDRAYARASLEHRDRTDRLWRIEQDLAELMLHVDRQRRPPR